MKLSEICDINRSNVIFTKDQMVDYLDTGNLTEGVIDSLTKVRYDEAPSRAQRAVQKNTILYSTVRPNLKHYGILEEKNPNMVVSTGFATIDIKENKKEEIDAHFLYYLIIQPRVTEHLHTIAQSSVSSYPSISPNDIGNLEFRCPRIDDQRRIASVLSNLDRKIALNRQINTNLEALARQLYDYWFVQFDFPDANGKPYKSSGGKMTYNEKLKRHIPEGWEVKKVGDKMRIFTGKKDVSKAIPGDYKFFSCAPDPVTSNEYLYDGAAVLVSGNGSYTGRVTYYNGKFDLYQRTYACVMEEMPESIAFFYYTLKYLFQPVYSGGKHGSSIPYIVLGDLADFIYAFDSVIVEDFNKRVKSIFDLQFKNMEEISSLTSQRDELLPLLMNGQVTIK